MDKCQNYNYVRYNQHPQEFGQAYQHSRCYLLRESYPSATQTSNKQFKIGQYYILDIIAHMYTTRYLYRLWFDFQRIRV